MPDDRIDRLTGAAAVPRQNGELVFEAPWQSRAFGMAVGLAEKGFYQWDEFRDLLIAEIAATTEQDPASSPATVYYDQWTAALEKLLCKKGLVEPAALAERRAEFASGKRAEVF